MRKLLATSPVALSLAGILAAASAQAVALALVGLLAAVSAKADQDHQPQSHFSVSSTPSGGGQERPCL